MATSQSDRNAALYSLLGVIVGIVLSLIPGYLIANRDMHQRLAAYYAQVGFEMDTNREICDDVTLSLSRHYGRSNPTSVNWSFTRLSDRVWTSALSNGEFVATSDKSLLVSTRKLYERVDFINALIGDASLYAATPSAFATMPVVYTKILQICRAYSNEALGIFDRLKIQDEQERVSSASADRWLRAGIFTAVILFALMLWSVRPKKGTSNRTQQHKRPRGA